jgi:plasmid stabilization system protein ParE
MKYAVLVQPRAAADLEAAYARAAARAPDTAIRWYNRFVESLGTLAENPQRCGLAQDNDSFSAEIRQLIFRSPGRSVYRALFKIVGHEVRILCIRAPGQDLAIPGDLARD